MSRESRQGPRLGGAPFPKAGRARVPGHALVLFLALLGASLAPSGAGAQADRRQPVRPGDPGASGLAPVVLVRPREPVPDPNAIGPGPPMLAEGTGALVSPCHVLTAYHLAFGKDPAGGPDRSYAVLATLAGIEAEGVPVTGNRLRDWALLEVRPCIGRSVGWFEPLAAEPPRPGRRDAAAPPLSVALPGHPEDRPGGLWVDPACRVVGTEDFGLVWLHDCAVAPGNSGGPLLLADPSASSPAAFPCLVAVVTGYGPPPPGWRGPVERLGRATPVSQLLPEVAGILAAAGGGADAGCAPAP